jgi:hypothetical protein
VEKTCCVDEVIVALECLGQRKDDTHAGSDDADSHTETRGKAVS